MIPHTASTNSRNCRFRTNAGSTCNGHPRVAAETIFAIARIFAEMRIELNCAQCGQNRFDIVEDHADHVHVYCAECRHDMGTMAQLKERLAAEVIRRAERRQANAWIKA